MPANKPINMTTAQWASGIATAADFIATGISVPHSAVALGAGAAAVEAGPIASFVAYQAVNLEYQVTFGTVENVLGFTSLAATTTGDVFAGNTYWISGEGLVVGQDTYVSAAGFVAGLVPDVTVDAAVNTTSALYDLASLTKTLDKEGDLTTAPGDMLSGALPGNVYIPLKVHPPETPNEKPRMREIPVYND